MRIKLRINSGYKWWNINWCLSKKMHKYNSPAYRSSSGYKEWRSFGKFHNDVGPARLWADGYKEFYIHGEWKVDKD